MTKIGVLVVLLAALVPSCALNKEIPEDMSAKILILNGQTEFSRGRYRRSIRYYQAVIDRYGDDPALYIEATYEIAHIYMKKKKYDRAEPLLNEILNIYPRFDPGTLPGAFERLAQIELEKIPR